jgi:hypothetical protein
MKEWLSFLALVAGVLCIPIAGLTLIVWVAKWFAHLLPWPG